MYLVDYHTHPYAHGGEGVQPPHNIEILEAFVEQARNRGLKELGFSDHDRFLDVFNWENLKYFKQESSFPIRLGLEVNYKPEREQEIQKLMESLPLDYTIGSVHQIGDWEVDHPSSEGDYLRKNVDEIYREYFGLLEKSVKTGFFEIVGHIDLVKIFNYKPVENTVLELIEPLLQKIKEMDMAIEVNTNGLNKPVQEIYPSEKILKRAFTLDIPITLGSDAHRADRTGENLEKAARILKEIGYDKIAVFENKNREFKRL